MSGPALVTLVTVVVILGAALWLRVIWLRKLEEEERERTALLERARQNARAQMQADQAARLRNRTR